MIHHHHNNGDYDNIVYNPSTLNTKNIINSFGVFFSVYLVVSPKYISFSFDVVFSACPFLFRVLRIWFDFFFVFVFGAARPRGVSPTQVQASCSSVDDWMCRLWLIGPRPMMVAIIVAVMAMSNFDEFNPALHRSIYLTFSIFALTCTRSHKCSHLLANGLI